MSYEFIDLPYAYDALSPIIDEQTMHLHKDKHHKAYFTKFVELIAATEDNGKPVKEIMSHISKLSAPIRNNLGGYFNHDLYFNGMRAPKEDNAPTGELLDAINSAFGSFDKFKEQFAASAAGQFGSGWGWLIVKDGKLAISHTPNQDNPLMDVAEVKGAPILGCDVWEHAYYLTYNNRRPDYISHWWQVVNWDFVAKNFAEAK